MSAKTKRSRARAASDVPITYHIYVVYTPNLGWGIAVPGREREQSRFDSSHHLIFKSYVTEGDSDESRPSLAMCWHSSVLEYILLLASV